VLVIFEIVLLIASISAIATIARRRGSDTVLWGGLALGGYLLIIFSGGALATHFISADDAKLYLEIAAWFWVGGMFLLVRFAIGATKVKPDGMWSCPDCRYLNAANAIVCEACGKPYAVPVRKPAAG
jgi:hypothetical protein